MSELIPKLSGHHDYVWRCDCGDNHYVTVTWDDTDPQWRFLSLTTSWWAHGFRARLRGAWRILLRKGWCAGDVLLDEANTNDLLAVLSKHQKDAA